MTPKQFRETLGLTQEQMGSLLNCHWRSILRAEHGTVPSFLVQPYDVAIRLRALSEPMFNKVYLGGDNESQ